MKWLLSMIITRERVFIIRVNTEITDKHRRVWRYQSSTQNPKSNNYKHSNGQKKKKGETTIYNDVQHFAHKTKDWVTRTPPKSGGEHRCSGKISSSCSTSGTRLVTNPVISLKSSIICAFSRCALHAKIRNNSCRPYFIVIQIWVGITFMNI